MKKEKIVDCYKNVGKKVKIVPLGLEGKIGSVLFHDNIVEYGVKYYLNGSQQRVYYEENEVEFLEVEKNLGFQ